MKKLVLLFSIFAISTNFVCANSNFGFNDNFYTKVTIADALKMNNDTHITIEGNIIKRLSEDEYLFSDGKCNIVVEIDNDKWFGNSANSTDKLQLKGEIDKDYYSTKLDVDFVSKLNK